VNCEKKTILAVFLLRSQFR